MTRRLGLIGAECSGKTTLALALAAELPACVCEEELRGFVTRMGRPPRVDEQQHVITSQIAREDQLARTCRLGTVIADPAPLMTAVYSLAYFDDQALIDAAVEHARRYDLLVWCDIDLPWAADPGQRDGPEYRARVHGLLASIVDDQLKTAGITVLRVSGRHATRIAAVTRAWQTLPPIVPT